MAHIPMNDVEQLWNETSRKDWKGLHDTLEKHRNKGGGIEDALVDDMLKISEDMQGKQYPESPQKLYDVLNQHAKSMPHS